MRKRKNLIKRENLITRKKILKLGHLDYEFYLWLYKSLKEYMKYAPYFVNLQKIKIMYNGTEHTQSWMITQLLGNLEGYLEPLPYRDEVAERISEIREAQIMKLWTALLPYMRFML